MNTQAALPLPPAGDSNLIVINARCRLRIDADRRVIAQRLGVCAKAIRKLLGPSKPGPVEQLGMTTIERVPANELPAEAAVDAVKESVAAVRAPSSDSQEQPGEAAAAAPTDDGEPVAMSLDRDPSDRTFDRQLAYRMFDRWRQENFFNYMREEFLIDALVDYRIEAEDPTRTVPNPQRRVLDKQIRAARAELAKLEREYGAAAADNREQNRPTMRGFKTQTGHLRVTLCQEV